MTQTQAVSEHGWRLEAFDPPDEAQAREIARFMRSQHSPPESYPREKDRLIDWKLRRNVRHPGFASAMVTTSDERVVSLCTITPKRLWAFGAERPWAEIGDTFTDPAYHRRGMFSAVVNATRERAERGGFPLIFGLPNDQSAPGYTGKLNFPIKADTGHVNCSLPVSARALVTRLPASRSSAPWYPIAEGAVSNPAVAATSRALVDTPRTTIVACVMQGSAAYWAHCGDSRLYLQRGDKLIARTRDHSYSELQETMAQLVPPQERMNRNVLFTCLGSPGKPMIDTTGPLLLHPGDRVLLCSDGLWSALPDSVITSVLVGPSIADAVPELVEQALRQAGPRSDNVTALAVEWESAQDSTAVSAVSTRSLGDDVFASTIQASLQGELEEGDELDEAEIERSIREINEAIQRSSAKRG